MQILWASYSSNYKEPLIEVILKVHTDRAYHFKAKNYLPSQRVIEEKEDRTLLSAYTITQDIEMQDIVKRWIPYVQVISPQSLKASILKDINRYLKCN